ncbi:MAG: UDP-N-acetylglucosamine 2-epimerase (non-hydrolyzing) [Legionellales bacterium]|nr:UDP-N-acetylglucosamine 2-epimerase (non-hydrolyzing) [Legionellales bacterium]
MKNLKIITIVGTRPEIIKLSRVLAELEHFSEHILVHTGQNYDYELNQVFFEQLEIKKPNYFLDAAANTACETTGNVIGKIEAIFLKEKPDAILILGDTNSCLCAYTAKRLHIPVFHMEAGNRCFDQRVPEEINRKIVDHISDINLVYTEHARRYLIAEGLKPDMIIKTGSPMREVLNYYHQQIDTSNVLSTLKLKSRKYFLVSTHREENVDTPENIMTLLDALMQLTMTYNMPIIVSTHPRTRQRLEAITSDLTVNENIHFLKPLGFFEYNKLQQEAFCVLSDSGTITEESSILNFPAVTIRNAHERPEGMDEATLVMCGLTTERILQSVNLVTKQASETTRAFELVNDYQPNNVSKKVVRIIYSYVNYVNQLVWKK